MKYIWLCLLSFIVAAVFIYCEHEEKYVPAVILKGTASLLFVITGFLSGKMNPSGISSTIIIGLLLGCIADVLLNLRFVFPRKGQMIFLVGIVVFLSGHIAYLAALLPLIKSRIMVLVISIILTALLMIWIFKRITAKMAFKIFGVVYIGAIMAMNCVACANLIQTPSAFSAVYMAGAFLFLISDIVLILNTFGSKTRFSMRITNLSLYYVGQILIALSLQLVK